MPRTLRILIGALALVAACAGPESAVEPVDEKTNAEVKDEIGQPCDPATYAGQYRCVASEDGASYSIAQ